ncbi:MAG: hypothetical protein RLZZ139_1616, partial [Cyanobacteriota bacterium]
KTRGAARRAAPRFLGFVCPDTGDYSYKESYSALRSNPNQEKP